MNKENNWTYTWNGLPEKSEGKTIEYKVKEVGEVKGYTTSYSEDTFTITNSHDVEKTSVTGTKTWNDADNQDGIRPEKIVVRLYANGKEVASQEVTEATEWKYAFNDLDKYEAGERSNTKSQKMKLKNIQQKSMEQTSLIHIHQRRQA